MEAGTAGVGGLVSVVGLLPPLEDRFDFERASPNLRRSSAESLDACDGGPSSANGL
jgi:hypothetical protein